MATGPRYHVQLRRRREGRTDFRLRLGLLKSGKPRLVVRSTSKNIHVQLVEFDPKGDKVLAEATALELRKHGYKGATGNSKAAYLAGYLLGKKAGKKEAIVDFGLQYPHGLKIRSAVKGAIDAGMQINFGEKELPADDKLKTEEVTKVISSMKV